MKIANILLTFLPIISTFYLLTFLTTTAFSQNHTHLGLPIGAKARLGKGKIYQLKYFPDGKRLAVATSIGIHIYDVQTGEPLDLLTGHTGPIECIVFSPDGRTFATGSEDNTIRLWDANTGKHKATCIGHEDDISFITFNPAGDILASVDYDESNRFWDVQTGKQLKTAIESDVTPTYALTYSPDGALFLTIGRSDKSESYIEYWDAQAGNNIKNVLIEEDFDVAAISPQRKILACGGHGPLYFWDLETGERLKSVEKADERPESLEFSPDGRKLVTGSSWETVSVWEVSTAKLLKTFGGGEEFNSVTYSPDGKTVAAGADDGIIRFWDVATGELKKEITGHLSSEIYAATYSPDGSTLTCGSERKIQLWNPQTGELLKTATEPGCKVYSVVYSSDAKLLATGGTSKKARLWDVGTGRFLGSFTGHKDTIYAVAISPDQTLLASGGGSKSPRRGANKHSDGDNTVSLWEIRTGELYHIGERLATFTEHTARVSSVTFSPDGKTLASGSQDKTIQLWDVNTHTHYKTLTGHEGGVTAVVYAFYGSTLASGSEDGTIRLWNTHTGDLLLPPIEGAGHVTSLAYSPDDRILASASEDPNYINIWDALTGKHLHTFMGHTHRVNAVLFSPDGKTLASVSSDSTILLWDLTVLNLER